MSEQKHQQSGILKEMMIDDVCDLDPETVVLSVAATESHDPHLPYGSDFFQTDEICRRAVT